MSLKHHKDFWSKAWREVEPLMTHLVVVLALVVSLAVVGVTIIGLGKLIDRLMPNHLGGYILLIEQIDFWLIIACLVEFGLYTLAIIGIRLFKEIKNEYRETASEVKEGAGEP